MIPFFCYLLIFVKKVLKANISAFTKTIFLTPRLTLTNMSNMFFAFFTPFFLIFFKTKFFRDSWGVNTALSKIMCIFCKKLLRNYIPKLTTFSCFFQLPHSALVECKKSNIKCHMSNVKCKKNVKCQYFFFIY